MSTPLHNQQPTILQPQLSWPFGLQHTATPAEAPEILTAIKLSARAPCTVQRAPQPHSFKKLLTEKQQAKCIQGVTLPSQGLTQGPT